MQPRKHVEYTCCCGPDRYFFFKKKVGRVIYGMCDPGQATIYITTIKSSTNMRLVFSFLCSNYDLKFLFQGYGNFTTTTSSS